VSAGGFDRPPVIVITRGTQSGPPDAERAIRSTGLYVDAVTRAGGEAVVLDPSADRATRSDALARMSGLLLSGGVDIDPSAYGESLAGAVDMQPERDALEREAWDVAAARALPVLGICRGFQAINVFSGGRLLQHVDGHTRPAPAQGPPLVHRLRVMGGTQLARILRPTNPGTFVVQVNSSHHQAVRAEDVAPGLLASAWSPSPSGEIVEGLEGIDPRRFVLGVQSHPERVESTRPEFERLFRFFVDAARHSSLTASAAR
jgi:putative glutamine amidotransferase